MRNKPPLPEHDNMVREYAAINGWPVHETDYNNPLLRNASYLGADGGGAGGWGGDAFPGEEPQAIEDRNQRLDTETRDAYQDAKPEEYNFVYSNGQFHISDSHSHSDLADNSGTSPDHTGPMAVGRVYVDMGKATFEIQANVSAQGLSRVLKDYCEQVGWRWGGMTDLTGEPIGTGSEFAPVKSYALQWLADLNELEIAKSTKSQRTATILHVDDFSASAWVYGRLGNDAFSALKDFCDDEGLTLYGGNDNVLKRHEDLEVDNNYSPEWNDAEDHFLFDDPPDERLPGGVFRCPDCSRIFPNWGIYIKHRKTEEGPNQEANQDGRFPELDMDATFPPHFDEMRQEPGIHTGAGPQGWYDRSGMPDWDYWLKNHDPEEMEQYMYHAAPTEERARIQAHGIQPAKPNLNPYWDYSLPTQPAAVYLTDQPHQWAMGTHNFRAPKKDIWRVPVSQIDQAHLQEDPKLGHPYYMYPHALQAELFTPYEKYSKKTAAGTDPKDMIPAPVPFLYDIQNDEIVVGTAGQKHSDIPGKFTPGGIVEGTYEPGGQVLIKSLTNMPYSVRHLLELWTYEYPTMEIRNIHMQDDEGKRTKLAAEDIGSALRTLVAAHPPTWRVYKALTAAGGTVYVVGGAVRDMILGKTPNDFDIMVTGIPQEEVRHTLATLPGKLMATGNMAEKPDEEKIDTAHAFGVFHYYEGSEEDKVEIALPRREKSTGSGSKTFDKEVDHRMSPEEDLYRRDFTANAMAVNLSNGQMIDPFNGASDVRNRQLRTLHTKSLGDDPLRIVRALTAFSKHGLYPTEDTKAQMQEYAGELKYLPQDRIRKDLDKLFSGQHPGEAIRLSQETGTLPFILPEVSATYGWSQNNPHHELELFDHLVSVLDRAQERKPGDIDFALAALLHDIGKKDSHWTECRDCAQNDTPWMANGHHETCPQCGGTNTSGHFYQKRLADGTTIGGDHETVGAELARKRLNTLRYPKDRINRVVNLIQHHMFPAFTSEKGARRFLRDVGDHADDLLHLRWADQGGKSEYPTDPTLSTDTQMALVNAARETKVPTNKSMLAINGRDLFGQVNIPEGPQRGQLLNYLLEQVVDNPELNTQEALLGLARTWKPSQPQ